MSRFFRYDHESGQVVESTHESVKGIAHWPMKSEAMGILPNQIAEASEFNRKNGVPTEYTRDGRPVLTSPGHRRRLMKLWNFYDRSGYD